MITPSLDLDAVRTFIRIAELGSFTLTAEQMGTTQAAVSLKLKRLEERLGCRLVDRSPRHVSLSAKGAAFLSHAREILESHDRAVRSVSGARRRLTLGISDHVAGPDLPAFVARMNAEDPGLLIEIHIGSTLDLLQRFDRREFDAVLARHHAGREDGVALTEEQFGWYAASHWQHRTGDPIPLATMPEPCGIRVMAGQLLDEAGVPWTETFVGGGVAAVSAAVVAGLGVSALARRMLPLGVIDVGPRLGLPELPRLPVLLHSRVTDGRRKDALAALSAAFQGAAQNR